MSRTGVEAKPLWRAVPRAIRHEVEQILGVPVRRAMRVWGGYGPSATFRLQLADGRRAFFKGVHPDANDHMRRALEREEHVYRQLADRIAPWAPAFYGAFRHDTWHVLLLEDLGPASAPPWTTGKARTAARSYADFHRATLDSPLPDWLSRRAHHSFGARWQQLAGEPGGIDALAGLAGTEADAARQWLRQFLPELRDAAEQIAHIPPPYALLHLDTRSDNLRLQHGQLRLFDWPYAAVGPAEFDAVAFAQSVACEGGPAPEQALAWYAERLDPRGDAVDAAVAAVAGYFADQAWRPEVPGLPRLRAIQRCQLRASLQWAARRLDLAEPTWLEMVRA